MRRLLKLIAIPLTVFLALGYGIAFYEVVQRMSLSARRVQVLLIGVGLYGGVYVFWIRRLQGFWRTFEHELTHALFATLFFQRIESFRATAGRGGQVQHSGRWGGNFIISLAPYFFPTVTLVPLGLLFLVSSSIQPYLVGAVGFTSAYHLIATLREARPVQTDLKRHGVVFSYAVIVFLNLICLGLVLTLTVYGTDAAGRFLLRGLEVFYKDGIVLFQRLIG